MDRFWFGWLTIWCWGVLAFGALLVTAAIPGFDAAAREVFLVFGGGTVDAATFEQPSTRFGLGLQGALTLGWGMTMILLIGAARTIGASLWRGLTIAVLIWYVIDSAISVATGFGLNAVSNTVFVIAFLIPIIASGALRPRGA